jgi:Ribbon-helix-helix protein, copG family.
LKEIEIPAELYWKLDEKAKRKGLSVDDFVRDLIRKKIKEGELNALS